MRAHRPQDLVFTLFGEFLLHPPRPVWTGTLIGLLEAMGVSTGNARMVLSRMARKGWLEPRRSGRHSYYSLSARGLALLEEGEARIYNPPREADWDGEWTLVWYSIPEEQREARDRLRVRLAWLGYGSLGNGLHVSPHDTRDQVLALAESFGVRGRVEVFRGRRESGVAIELVAQAWDLAAINERYEAFVATHLPGYYALRSGPEGVVTDADAFVRRFELVHDYREFPLLDPFLPRALQPDSWAGECALALFEAYHALLLRPSARYLESRVRTLEPDAAAAA
jgi:phenylacetic acid degradation operon negative regulatory protein